MAYSEKKDIDAIDKPSEIAELLFGSSQAVEGEGNVLSPEEIVLAKLNPYGEIDDHGFGREIFNFGDSSAIFRSREEMPIYPTAMHIQTEIVGEDPIYLNHAVRIEAEDEHETTYKYTKLLEHYKSNKDKLLSPRENTSGKKHYSVDRSLDGVVGLLCRLDPKNAEYKQMQAEISRGVYSDKALMLLDGLIAVGNIDLSKNGFTDHANTSAEAIVVLAMQGDLEAQRLTSLSIECMRRFDEARVARDKAEYQNREMVLREEAARPEELVCVHSTSYEPKHIGEGQYEIKTTFDSTKYFPRSTLHTTINIKIVIHGN